MPSSPGKMPVFLACLAATALLAPWSHAQDTQTATGQTTSQQSLIPLTAIDVDARVEGNLAEVTVEQTFENRLGERLEAVYVFPLPDDAAVTEMIMVIGDRRIRADLRERRLARDAYEQARAQGQVASLLEQERPNVFTMSVANIQPGLPIRVRVRYVEELPYRDGRYHFHFPTTVGPRFIPGSPTGHAGAGRLPDTDRVPDASRLTPATLPAGVPTPYEVDFALSLHAGMPIDSPSGSTALDITRLADDHFTATLRPDSRQPNRDLELSYALAQSDPAIGLLAHAVPEQGGYFSLMLEPPPQPRPEDVRPKEMIFVIDCSGSMTGVPIDTAKAAVRHALRHLNPGDTFQIVRFSDASSALSPIPLANTPANVARGVAFINAMSGGGGTMMTAGIEAALRPPADPQRLRIVLFLTDGFIGNEREILALINREVGQARLFSLGVGSSVNRSLLDRMAERGRGAVHYLDAGDDPTATVTAFYDRIRNPVLTDIQIDWGGLAVHDLTPRRIPDVFSGTPIQVTGQYTRAGTGTVTVRGKEGTRLVAIPLQVTLPPAADRPAVAHLWARRRIAALELEHGTDLGAAQAAVLPLALRYGLLTAYTSFVAIEERIRADAQDPLHTQGVPVALPAGMSDTNIGPQVMTQDEVTQTVRRPSIRANSISLGRSGAVASGSGYGRGAGGLRGRRASVPTIRTGAASVRGSLAREVIRRYIRRSINQVRACYERRLSSNPSMAGRVAVRFVIGADGRVVSATVASSTLGDPQAEQCIARAVQQIRFPTVDGGGVVLVTYPFMFQPSQGH